MYPPVHGSVQGVMLDPCHTAACYPPCFRSQEQYDSWCILASRKNSLSPLSYCTDCTAEYQAEMLLEQRCAHPETQFVEVLHVYPRPPGGIVFRGRFPPAKWKMGDPVEVEIEVVGVN